MSSSSIPVPGGGTRLAGHRGREASRPSSRNAVATARTKRPDVRTRTPLGDASARSRNVANSRTRRLDEFDAGGEGDPKRRARLVGPKSSGQGRSQSRIARDGAIRKTRGGMGEATLASPSDGRRPPSTPGEVSMVSHDGGSGLSSSLSSLSNSSSSAASLSRIALSPRVVRSATGSIGSGPSRRVPVAVPVAGRRLRGKSTPAEVDNGIEVVTSSTDEVGHSNPGSAAVLPPRKRRGTTTSVRNHHPPASAPPPAPTSSVTGTGTSASASVGMAVRARYQSPTVSSRRAAVFSSSRASSSTSVTAVARTTNATTNTPAGRRTGIGQEATSHDGVVAVGESSSTAEGAASGGRTALRPSEQWRPQSAASVEVLVDSSDTTSDQREDEEVQHRRVQQLQRPPNPLTKNAPTPSVTAADGGDESQSAASEVRSKDRLDVGGAGEDREPSSISSSVSSPKVASRREVDEARRAAEYRVGIQLRLAEQKIDALRKEMEETRLFYEVEERAGGGNGKGGAEEGAIITGSVGEEEEKEGSGSAAIPSVRVDDLLAKVKLAKEENERLSNENSALVRQNSELVGEQSSLRATLEMYEMASSSREEEISDDRQVLQQTISLLEAERDEVRSKLDRANELLLLRDDSTGRVGDDPEEVGGEREDGKRTTGGCSHEQEMAELRTSLDEAEAERERSVDDVRRLREEIDKARASLLEERDRASSLRESLDEMSANLDDCRGNLDRERDGRAKDRERFESETGSLHEELRTLAEVSGQNKVLVNENKELMFKLKDVEAENTRLLDEDRILAQEMSDLRRENSSLKATAEKREVAFSSQEQEWKHKLSVVQAERDEALEQLDCTRTDAQSLEDRIRGLEIDRDEARQELAESDRQNESSIERIRLLEAELEDVHISTEISTAAMTKSVKDANARVEILEQSCGAREKDIVALRGELSEAKRTLSSKNAALEDVNSSLREKDQRHEAMAQGLRASLDKARAKLEDAASREVDSAALIDGLKQSLRDSNERTTEAESRVTDASDDIEALRARVKELELSLEEAEATIDAELSEHNSKVSDLRTSAEQEICAIRSAHAKEIRDLQSVVTDRKEATSRLELSLASANSLNNDQTRTIEKLRLDLEVATSTSSERGRRLEDLEHSLSELRSMVGKLSREKQLALDGQTNLVVQKKSLQAELCSLEGKLSDLDKVRRELDEVSNRRATMETTLTSCQAENIRLRECIDEKSHRMSGLETDLSTVKGTFSESLKRKDAQLELVQKEISDVKFRHEKSIASLRLEHDANMARTEEKLMLSSERVSELEVTAADLQRRLVEVTSAMEDHKSQSSTLKHSLEETKSSLTSKVAQLKNDVSKKSRTVAGLETERDSLRGDISSLQASIEMYEMSLRDFEEERDQRSGEAKAHELEMQARLEKAESEKAELLAKFELLEVEYAKLDKTVVRNKEVKGIKPKSWTSLNAPSLKDDDSRDRIEMEAIAKYMMHREEQMLEK